MKPSFSLIVMIVISGARWPSAWEVAPSTEHSADAAKIMALPSLPSNIALPHRCTTLSDTDYKEDVLIVAGDIADDTEVVRKTLVLLLSKWAHVFFTPGNHELWVRRGEADVRDSFGELRCTGHGGRSDF